jgi:Fe-S oxidoreductase
VLAKLASGMAQPREIPAFAPCTFKEWFAARPPQHDADRRHVILWPDTFNDHFHPHTAIAAVHVLERAGFHVRVPREPMCCGRPLYDYGMLDRAKRWLRHIMSVLADEIQEGTPIVVLEPSCAAVFRDELCQLFPDDETARLLSAQVYLLSEWLNQAGYHYPKLYRSALVHGHCHHRAVLGLAAEEAALAAMGLDANIVESGCCGMAGSFGFERAHYGVSIKAGERVLLPAVRKAARDTLIVADGFSCRLQIAQHTDRRAGHLAELIEMAQHDGAHGPVGDLPEQRYVEDFARTTRARGRRDVLTGAALSAGTAALAYALCRRGRRVTGGPSAYNVPGKVL